MDRSTIEIQIQTLEEQIKGIKELLENNDIDSDQEKDIKRRLKSLEDEKKHYEEQLARLEQTETRGTDTEPEKEEKTAEKKDTPVEPKKENKPEEKKNEKAKKSVREQIGTWLLGRYNHSIENQAERVKAPHSYFLPRAGIATAVATVFIISGGGLGVISTLALGYVALAGTKYAAALIRKNNNYEPKKLETADMKKGSWFDNVKKAFKNLVKTNDKVKAKDNKPKKSNKPKTTNNTENKEEKPALDKLIHDFNLAIDAIDLNDINLNDYNNKCVFIYNQINTHYGENGLNSITKERKDKYNKINHYQKLIKNFIEDVNSLDLNNIDKMAFSKCEFTYNALQNQFGANAFKNVPKEVIDKYNEYLKRAKNKKEENVVINENAYIKALLQKMYNFDLVTTKKCVQECEGILKEIDEKVPQNADLRKNNKYIAVWNKYAYLKEALVSKKKVLQFVDLVNELSNTTGTRSYNKFKICFDIQNSFTETEWEELGKIDVNGDILKKYRTILETSRDFILEEKLRLLDIEKCITDNNYDEINEIVHIADSMIKEAKDKGTKNPITNLKPESKKKLTRAREVLSTLASYNKINVQIKLVVNKNDLSIKAQFNNNEGKIIEMPLTTKFDGNINDVAKNIRNEINAINPLISADKIEITSIVYEKVNKKSSHK